MNNELQLFDFENNKIRVLKINNEPWFVGKDLATSVTVTEGGESHTMNLKDLKVTNTDVLLQIADLLGIDINN